ncbi:hypothetical protein NDU88_001067 [Pleurodeles waltl]|uniref:Uncharacterized protein n=1 Tax=Pleurodeles waltl TaxID=8319 RepID=A0AAV7P328_PLEWA|nr:hypothetical protein NDU88_001067 [Pleurodeles waltl]
MKPPQLAFHGIPAMSRFGPLKRAHVRSQDLLTYITPFNPLPVEADWPVEKLTSLFYQGLHSELKDVLAQVVKVPQTCKEFRDLMEQKDQQMQERKGDKNWGEIKYVAARPRVAMEEGLEAQTEWSLFRTMVYGVLCQ